MSEIAVWIGYVVIVAFAILTAGVGLVMIVSGVERLWTRHDLTVKMEARAEAGRALQADTWWFSEHEPTRELLAEIALNLQTGRGILDVSPARERWRKRMLATRGE